MAQRVQVLLTDDLDGSEADETVPFALDGISYEIELSESNAQKLRDVLASYITAGRRVGGRSTRRQKPAAEPAAPVRVDLADVREWARANGYQVSDRGRISSEVRAAYEAAQ